MSTKIYEAYKINLSKINNFIEVFDNFMFKRAKDIIKMFMDALKYDDEAIKEIYDKKGWNKEMSYDQFIKEKGDFTKARLIFKLCYNASCGTVKDSFDVDASLNLWIYKKYCYIIPYYARYNNDLDFNPPDFALDFSYWNNTDCPKNIIYKKWCARGKLWNNICLDNWDKTRLLHQTINFKDNIGLYKLSNMILGEKGWSVSLALNEINHTNSDTLLLGSPSYKKEKIDESIAKLKNEQPKN